LVETGAQPGVGIWGISPPKFSKQRIGIFTFAEIFKNKDEILYSTHF